VGELLNRMLNALARPASIAGSGFETANCLAERQSVTQYSPETEQT
jgi:hypothetical protein